MKTLKKLLLFTLFAGAVQLAVAGNKYVKKYEVKSYTELRTHIAQFVKEDFARAGNYFYKNDINDFKEDVVIKFFINDEKEMKLLNVESENEVAVQYVEQLFRDAKINVGDNK